MDLAEKIGQLEKLGTDLTTLKNAMNQIRADIDDVHGTINDIAGLNFHVEKLDPKEFLKGLPSKAGEVIDWMIEKIPGVKDIFNWITGDADKLNAARDSWSTKAPSAMEAQKANLKKAAGDLDEAWKGKVATEIGKIMAAAGGPVLDAVEDVQKGVGAIFAFIARLLKKLHDFIISLFVKLLEKILEKLAQMAVAASIPVIGWIGEAINFGFALYDFYKTGEQLMKDFSKLNHDMETACTSAKTALNSGEAAWKDFLDLIST